MFPVTDFNFMVAGIATFAATVGYTYARGKFNTPTWVPIRLSPSSKTEISSEGPAGHQATPNQWFFRQARR